MIIAFLDLFWSVAALLYDATKLSSISWYLWPLVIVCPLYPLLLAIVFYKITKNKPVNQFLIAFATVGSASFSFLALAFYPMLMINEGFDILGLGQILWVLFYSVQGWYLISRFKLKVLAIIAVNVYLVVKFLLDYKYLSFGYLNLDKLNHIQILMLLIIGLAGLAVINTVVWLKSIDR